MPPIQMEVSEAMGVKSLLSGFNCPPSFGDLINQIGKEFPGESFNNVGIAVDPYLSYTLCCIEVLCLKDVPADWFFTSIADLQREASKKFHGMSYYDLFPEVREGKREDEYEVHLRGRIPLMDGDPEIQSGHELQAAS
ncbi:MAG TPA: hypothetical protein VJH70_03165 [Candidatus Paceibacterota bacterium]